MVGVRKVCCVRLVLSGCVVISRRRIWEWLY